LTKSAFLSIHRCDFTHLPGPDVVALLLLAPKTFRPARRSERLDMQSIRFQVESMSRPLQSILHSRQVALTVKNETVSDVGGLRFVAHFTSAR